jgi:hypothetical protein
MGETEVYSLFSWVMLQDLLNARTEFLVLLEVIASDSDFFRFTSIDSKAWFELRNLAKGLVGVQSRKRLMRTSKACSRLLAWTRRIISEMVLLRNREDYISKGGL